jgi:hypothetical protein
MELPTLYYPHEHFEELQARLAPYKMHILDGWLRWDRALNIASDLPLPGPADAEQLYRTKQNVFFGALNGTVDGAGLGHKDHFLKIMNELEFRTPQSLILPYGHYDRNQLLEQICALDPTEMEGRRVVKAMLGEAGQQVTIVEDEVEAVDLIMEFSPHLSLIVQAYEAGRDWRYILHRDAAAVENGDPPNVRIAYEKVRPSVIGDGISTIGQLLEASDMPDRSKFNIRARGHFNLDHVVWEGMELELALTGNVYQGAYVRLPSPEELAMLDTHGIDLWNRLEQRFGRLSVVCFDLGQLASGDITHYEMQLPFALDYTDAVPVELKAPINTYMQHSMFASGVMLSGGLRDDLPDNALELFEPLIFRDTPY